MLYEVEVEGEGEIRVLLDEQKNDQKAAHIQVLRSRYTTLERISITCSPLIGLIIVLAILVNIWAIKSEKMDCHFDGQILVLCEKNNNGTNLCCADCILMNECRIPQMVTNNEGFSTTNINIGLLVAFISMCCCISILMCIGEYIRYIISLLEAR